MQHLITPLHTSWQPLFQDALKAPYFKKLTQFLNHEMHVGKTIYPPENLWFNAFMHTPLEKVKVVIVGQDPYIKPKQAMGLSFSVPQHIKLPPSLRNIFKELSHDVQLNSPEHGDLTSWTKQGVFLLNASLTVEQGMAGSHLKKGWEQFTQAALAYINQHKQNVVFLAWGAFAHKCCDMIDEDRHHVIRTSHPSPLGAYKNSKSAPAFLGSRCFSQANAYLRSTKQKEIDWKITHAA
tara:strand:+ start:3973 stop:4683 length:711 start_codon:yes stop_codon:yes gene_type:complete